MSTIRLTAAQALVKFLQNQYIEIDGSKERIFEGMFAIFGHGNVAGIGEALQPVQEDFPTYRAHNEQGMALAAVAYAKQHRRRRMMACTTSIGPGAANMITAAGVAYTNRLPVLFVPGDIFASRTPAPVLQELESFENPEISINDCFKPVSRYFDRINRPEQLITSLPAALRVLLDPATCGPATIAFPQDVQAMAFDYPESFFAEKVHNIIRIEPDAGQFAEALALLKKAEKPVIIAGGGVHYSDAVATLKAFAETHQIPVAETQAGKGALTWDHPQQLGSMGVTGSSAANGAVQGADLILAVGTRLQDFTTGSRSIIKAPVININVGAFDAGKHENIPLQGDAKVILEKLTAQLSGWSASSAWVESYTGWISEWIAIVDKQLAPPADDSESYLPTDAEVLGALMRKADDKTTVLCAAGGLPGELHKLWRANDDLAYHVEYAFSCMGYEIAGGLGAKMASPDREIVVTVGDGSYLMLNSEIATSVMLGQKMIVVVLDNRGYACINRLQNACGGKSFNNLLQDCYTVEDGAPKTDFAAHAKALGAEAEYVSTIAELEAAYERAKASPSTYIITLDTDPMPTTQEGGYWWEVAVPEVSPRKEVNEARENYENQKSNQPYGL